MGIRYEKDTILNWIEEIGKFLRLLIDKSLDGDPVDHQAVEEAYMKFFHKERRWMLRCTDEELLLYVEQELEEQQIRPLALLLLRDGLQTVDGESQRTLLRKAKLLIEYVSEKLGSFSFDDYHHLSEIEKRLK